MIISTRLAAALAATLFLAASAPEAIAAPKRSNGGTCDSTGTGRKTGTDDQGNKVDCMWDTCTFTECSTSGSTVSNCVKKTEYSNARDCKAASARKGGQVAPAFGGGTKLKKAP